MWNNVAVCLWTVSKPSLQGGGRGLFDSDVKKCMGRQFDHYCSSSQNHLWSFSSKNIASPYASSHWLLWKSTNPWPHTTVVCQSCFLQTLGHWNLRSEPARWPSLNLVTFRLNTKWPVLHFVLVLFDGMSKDSCVFGHEYVRVWLFTGSVHCSAVLSTNWPAVLQCRLPACSGP